jgi:hypothetical protein
MSRRAPRQYVSAFSVNAATAANVPLPPLVDDDRVRSLTIYARSAAGAVALDEITVALFASQQSPATATIAATGRVLLDTITVPLVPALLDPLVAATGVGSLLLKLPLVYTADQQTRIITAVITSGSKALKGIVALEVDRPEDAA